MLSSHLLSLIILPHFFLCGNEGLLEALVVNNTSARDSIHTLNVELLCSATFPDGGEISGDEQQRSEIDGVNTNVHSDSRIEFKKKGSWTYVRKTVRQNTDVNSGSEMPERVFVGVTNDRYSAFSIVPDVIEEHFHASLQSVSPREQELISLVFGGTDPVGLSYDTTSGPVRLVIESIQKGNWQLKVEEPIDGSGNFHIIAYHPGVFGGQKPEREYTFLANNGFVLSSIRVYNPKTGSARISREVEVQQLPNGIWFPSSISMTRGPSINRYTVLSAEANSKLEDDEFTVAALGLNRPDVTLVRYSVDGKKQAFRFVEGDWAPTDLSANPPVKDVNSTNGDSK